MLKTLPMNHLIQFKNTYSELPTHFYHKNNPTEVKDPQLILWNDPLAQQFNLNSKLDKKSIEQIFSGNLILPSAYPISTVYSGHQFGHFSPILGDGRAHILGELFDINENLYDFQLKGSGTSKYSRRGDGRSALGPVLREYIVSEAMHHLNIPTTRSLAALYTGEPVYREEALPGGILTRVSKSLLRVGHFEYFASKNDQTSLQILLNYAVKRTYPHLINNVNNKDFNKGNSESDLALSFFKEVAIKQAQLIAQWLSVGFIHGVMNTDNFSIAGLTLDYGPCAFLDSYDENQVYSFIDQESRYSYKNQSSIGKWNLIKLAEALFPIINFSENDYIHFINEVLHLYQDAFQNTWNQLMLNKLGLIEINNINLKLVTEWLNYLQKNKIDFTLGHRNLTEILNHNFDFYLQDEDFQLFKEKWLNLVLNQNYSKDEIVANLNKVNPLYIPRNHIVEQIIQKTYSNEKSELNLLIETLKNPFLDQGRSVKHLTLPPSENEKIKNTFCGT